LLVHERHIIGDVYAFKWMKTICATQNMVNFMEIMQVHKTKIEQIISEMECPKDFACHKSGFEIMGRTRLIADDQRVECLEENARLCKFALLFGTLIICECPLSNYIAKNLHI